MDDDDDDMCTGEKAQVQVIMNQLVCWPKLGSEMEKVGGNWTHVLGVKPTGWAHSRRKGLQFGQIKRKLQGDMSAYWRFLIANIVAFLSSRGLSSS